MNKWSAHPLFWGIVICLAVFALHLYPVVFPLLVYDDFQILLKSYTWSAAWNNLWLPANEHAMPLGRLSTAALVQLAGRPTALPQVMALQGPLALLAALVLLYLFVRRELGHPFYGLLAMALFGVTSIYHQAVSWFAASFSILTLDTLLMALLAAQSWRRTGRIYHLVLCSLWVALAPGWFASGILAGGMCCLYLLPLSRTTKDLKDLKDAKDLWRGFRAYGGRLAVALTPLMGSAAFLAVSLPRTAERILHTPHYGAKTALQAFNPRTGLNYTERSLVDNLTFGVFGISGVHCPLLLVPVVLVLLVVLLWWWCRRTPRHFVVLGLGLILLSYFLVYSARAEWPYDDNMNSTSWGRYHLLPQLGLTFLLCGGLASRQGQLVQLNPLGKLSREQGRLLGRLTLLLLVTQVPRELLATLPDQPRQREILRTIEVADARCRARHIGAEEARAALRKWQGQYQPGLSTLGLQATPGGTGTFLGISTWLMASPVLQLPYCGEDEDAWELLRGSDDPRPMSAEEALGLLLTTEPGGH